jgi:hypothetical protein
LLFWFIHSYTFIRPAYDDYLKINVISAGSPQAGGTASNYGAKGQLIMPFDAALTVGDVIHKIKGTIMHL